MLYGGAFLILVPYNLTMIEQGYWFTLVALGAMNRLADMGFLQLVLTYSAHAKIAGSVQQDEVACFTSEWRNKVLAWVFPLIFVIGLGILSFESFDSNIILAWAWYVIALAIMFHLNYLLAEIEGRGGVAFSHFSRGSVYLIATIITAIFLPYSQSLLVLPLGIFFGCILVLTWVNYKRLRVAPVNSGPVTTSKKLKSEFVQLFKNTSLSWTGGYLGTHAIVPLVYVFLGPVASGLAGMTLNVFMALQNFANVFLISIISVVTGHVATKSQGLARTILVRGLFKSLGVFIVLSLVLVLLLNLFPDHVIALRMLNDENLIYLSVGFGFQIIVSFIAIYIRAHKHEPFALMSIITSILGGVVLLIVFQTTFYDWVFIGFLISSVTAMVWSIVILRAWRKGIE